MTFEFLLVSAADHALPQKRTTAEAVIAVVRFDQSAPPFTSMLFESDDAAADGVVDDVVAAGKRRGVELVGRVVAPRSARSGCCDRDPTTRRHAGRTASRPGRNTILDSAVDLAGVVHLQPFGAAGGQRLEVGEVPLELASSAPSRSR